MFSLLREGICQVQQGVCPENILVMTFTAASANEFRVRVAKALGKTGKLVAERLTVSTYHSFCLCLWREHQQVNIVSDSASYVAVHLLSLFIICRQCAAVLSESVQENAPDFVIYTEAAQRRVVATALAEFNAEGEQVLTD